jgi:hypothetical protein
MTNTASHSSSHAVCHSVSHAARTAAVTVPPTRPDPTRSTYSLRSWSFRGAEIPEVEVELPAREIRRLR